MPQPVRLVILDPGHFHAALLQKTMLPGMDSAVHVYAPEGPDVADYLAKIESYNTRAQDPTRWETRLYTGPDYLERCCAESAGNLVAISGNNRDKARYIAECLKAGFNVLADKPMAIKGADFEALRMSFALAHQQGRLLYDIMTERHEITTILQRELSMLEPVFGTLLQGDAAYPAVVKESVHHFHKMVSGTPIKRPAWFFDTAQYGEGLVDITTHLVDLVQWACFPEQTLDWRKDVEVLSAKRWATPLSPAQFGQVTRLPSYPEYLKKDVQGETLQVYANGEINYRLRGIHAKVVVLWNFEAPAGAGDTHYSVMRGSRAELVIRQGAEQQYQPVLYVEPKGGATAHSRTALAAALDSLQAKYPGIGMRSAGKGWEITIPAQYHVGHEAHFGQVVEQFVQYLGEGKLPAWEEPNMLAKYYTNTRALALAHGAK